MRNEEAITAGELISIADKFQDVRNEVHFKASRNWDSAWKAPNV